MAYSWIWTWGDCKDRECAERESRRECVAVTPSSSGPVAVAWDEGPGIMRNTLDTIQDQMEKYWRILSSRQKQS